MMSKLLKVVSKLSLGLSVIFSVTLIVLAVVTAATAYKLVGDRNEIRTVCTDQSVQ